MDSLLDRDPFEEDKEFPRFTVASFKSWLKSRIQILNLFTNKDDDFQKIYILMYNSGEYMKKITRIYKLTERDSESAKLDVFCKWVIERVESGQGLRTPEMMINDLMQMRKKRKESHIDYLFRLKNYCYLVNVDFEGSVNVDRLFWSALHSNTISMEMRMVTFGVIHGKLYDDGKDMEFWGKLCDTAHSIDRMIDDCKNSKPRRRPAYCISCMSEEKCDCCYVCGSRNHFARDCPIE